MQTDQPKSTSLATPVPSSAPVIQGQGLTKAFRTYKKQPGFRGAIKGLFSRKYEQTLAVKMPPPPVEIDETIWG